MFLASVHNSTHPPSTPPSPPFNSSFSIPSRPSLATLTLPMPPDTPSRRQRSLSSFFPIRSASYRIKNITRSPGRRFLSFFALFCLAALSLLTLSNSLLFNSYAYPYSYPLRSKQRIATHTKNSFNFSNRKEITLSPAEELAAVVQFINGLTSSSLPQGVDPLSPIDPQLVCGFDTRGDRAREEVREMTEDVWSQHPVLLFREFRSTTSRAVNQMLDEMYIKPPPVVIDVDKRSDSEILIPLLKRLTGSETLPILLVGGQLAGPTLKDLIDLRESGTLRAMIDGSGAEVDGLKRGRKPRRK